MGGIFSYVLSWFSSPPALDTTPEPATGLSEQDKALIHESWALVSDRKTLKQNGVELFIQLFDHFPYMMKYFPKLQGMDTEQLRKSPLLRAHASGVMYMLTSYVENLHDTETLVALVQKTIASHMNRNITHQDFENLASIFVPYLHKILGKQVSPETKKAWETLLAAQNGLYLKAVNEAKSTKDS